MRALVAERLVWPLRTALATVGVMAMLKYCADVYPTAGLLDGRLFAAIACAISSLSTLGATARTACHAARGATVGGLLGWAAVAAASGSGASGLYCVLFFGALALAYSPMQPTETKLALACFSGGVVFAIETPRWRPQPMSFSVSLGLSAAAGAASAAATAFLSYSERAGATSAARARSWLLASAAHASAVGDSLSSGPGCAGVRWASAARASAARAAAAAAVSSLTAELPSCDWEPEITPGAVGRARAATAVASCAPQLSQALSGASKAAQELHTETDGRISAPARDLAEAIAALLSATAILLEPGPSPLRLLAETLLPSFLIQRLLPAASTSGGGGDGYVRCPCGCVEAQARWRVRDAVSAVDQALADAERISAAAADESSGGALAAASQSRRSALLFCLRSAAAAAIAASAAVSAAQASADDDALLSTLAHNPSGDIRGVIDLAAAAAEAAGRIALCLLTGHPPGGGGGGGVAAWWERAKRKAAFLPRRRRGAALCSGGADENGDDGDGADGGGGEGASVAPPFRLPLSRKRLAYAFKLALSITLAAAASLALSGTGVWSALAVSYVGPREGPSAGSSFRTASLRLLGTLVGALWGYVSLVLGQGIDSSGRIEPTRYGGATYWLLAAGVVAAGIVRHSPDHSYGPMVAQCTSFIMCIPIEGTNWVEGNTKNWAHLRIEANVIGIAIFAVIELLVLPQAAAAGARARVAATLRAAAAAANAVLGEWAALVSAPAQAALLSSSVGGASLGSTGRQDVALSDGGSSVGGAAPAVATLLRALSSPALSGGDETQPQPLPPPPPPPPVSSFDTLSPPPVIRGRHQRMRSAAAAEDFASPRPASPTGAAPGAHHRPVRHPLHRGSSGGGAAALKAGDMFAFSAAESRALESQQRLLREQRAQRRREEGRAWAEEELEEAARRAAGTGGGGRRRSDNDAPATSELLLIAAGGAAAADGAGGWRPRRSSAPLVADEDAAPHFFSGGGGGGGGRSPPPNWTPLAPAATPAHQRRRHELRGRQQQQQHLNASNNPRSPALRLKRRLGLQGAASAAWGAPSSSSATWHPSLGDPRKELANLLSRAANGGGGGGGPDTFTLSIDEGESEPSATSASTAVVIMPDDEGRTAPPSLLPQTQASFAPPSAEAALSALASALAQQRRVLKEAADEPAWLLLPASTGALEGRSAGVIAEAQEEQSALLGLLRCAVGAIADEGAAAAADGGSDSGGGVESLLLLNATRELKACGEAAEAAGACVAELLTSAAEARSCAAPWLTRALRRGWFFTSLLLLFVWDLWDPSSRGASKQQQQQPHRSAAAVAALNASVSALRRAACALAAAQRSAEITSGGTTAASAAASATPTPAAEAEAEREERRRRVALAVFALAVNAAAFAAEALAENSLQLAGLVVEASQPEA